MVSLEYEQVPSSSMMEAMEIEEPELLSSNRTTNTSGTSKIQLGVAALVSVIVSLSAVSFFRNQAVSNKMMSWPPPAVMVDNMDDFRIHVDGMEQFDTHRPRTLLCHGGSSISILGKMSDKSGGDVTILQKLEATTHNSVKEAGQVIVTDLDMSMDHNEIEILGNGKNIEITTNHIAMTMTSHTGNVELLNLHYDSENPDDFLDPQMQDLHAIIGQTTKIEVDDQGKVVKTTSSSDDAANDKDKKDKLFSSQNQWDQLTRMYKVLPPGKEVQPGDSWEFDMEMDVKFHGKATLLGYTTYDHSDCAVIQLKGNINFDSDQRELSDNHLEHGVEFEDGTVSAILYWDHNSHMARFSKSKVNVLMDVKNPLHPNAKSQLPTEESLTVYSAI
eukprot:CAMPEP_0194224050 /NCGR_PEP_ID=MMETSP0156-20130528/36543_1 /TAXON_ID=33649 /ORGANISM="Thalassionema nitzschioides, Strain L26-B" /LENGTH=387 /DNA_ID=CAMNT_0038955435 /DNA_START=41 /DNA_END=1201 /DNA_ORIENTATION=-